MSADTLVADAEAARPALPRAPLPPPLAPARRPPEPGRRPPLAPERRPLQTPPAVQRPAPSLPGNRRNKLHWLLEAGQYPLIAGLALGAAYSPIIGQAIVAVYVLVALIWRRRSRLTFGVTLLILASIPLFQAIGQSGIAQNAAIYVYELLVFGTAQALWEGRKIAKSTN